MARVLAPGPPCVGPPARTRLFPRRMHAKIAPMFGRRSRLSPRRRSRAGGAALAWVLVGANAWACQRVGADDYMREPDRPKPSDEDDDEDDGLPPWFEGSTEDEESGETVRPETGFVTSGGTEGGAMCPEVDILFVVDNSYSMASEQTNLANSYVGFIDGIQATLDDENDFHLGVVSTDDFADNDEGCREIGDLVTRTASGPCGPYAAGNFMSAADVLEQSFTCAARVGTEGDPDERPLAAALDALAPEKAVMGGCNEGFAREDALLILVLISDEDDHFSPGEPAAWFDELVAARGGVESNIVVLSVIGVDEPSACGLAKAEPGARIADFTQRFTYAGIADVCVNDYAPFFDQALSLVYNACSGFTPPG